jgi:hypothetical protein
MHVFQARDGVLVKEYGLLIRAQSLEQVLHLLV